MISIEKMALREKKTIKYHRLKAPLADSNVHKAEVCESGLAVQAVQDKTPNTRMNQSLMLRSSIPMELSLKMKNSMPTWTGNPTRTMTRRKNATSCHAQYEISVVSLCDWSAKVRSS